MTKSIFPSLVFVGLAAIGMSAAQADSPCYPPGTPQVLKHLYPSALNDIGGQYQTLVIEECVRVLHWDAGALGAQPTVEAVEAQVDAVLLANAQATCRTRLIADAESLVYTDDPDPADPRYTDRDVSRCAMGLPSVEACGAYTAADQAMSLQLAAALDEVDTWDLEQARACSYSWTAVLGGAE